MTDPHALDSTDPGPASRRRCRSWQWPPRRRSASSRLVHLALCLAVAASACRVRAFSSPAPARPPPARCLGWRMPRLSAVAEPPTWSPSSPGHGAARAVDFQRRARMQLVRRRGGGRGTGNGAADRPPNLRTARTLEEYKEALDEAHDEVVVVRFFATWCKACKAVQAAYYRLASLHPHLTFLDVPVTNHNANLHQGLGVPSLPYGHVYHPAAGLVEELRISRRHFPDLVRKVRWYDAGECALDEAPPPSGERGEA